MKLMLAKNAHSPGYFVGAGWGIFSRPIFCQPELSTLAVEVLGCDGTIPRNPMFVMECLKQIGGKTRSRVLELSANAWLRVLTRTELFKKVVTISDLNAFIEKIAANGSLERSRSKRVASK